MSRPNRRFTRARRLAAVIGVVALGLVLWRDRAAPPPALLVTLAPSATAGTSAELDEHRPADRGGYTLGRWELGSSPDTTPAPILEGFASIDPPCVAFDGRRAAFSGRRSAEEPRGIWEIASTGGTPRLVVSGDDCRDPAYLPDDRIAFSRRVSTSSEPEARALFTIERDGSDERRLTFGAARDRAPAVLADGRIVFRRHRVGESGPGQLLEVNTDGTGLQLFCAPDDVSSIESGPWVLGETVYFAESELDDERVAEGAAPRALDEGGSAATRLVRVSSRAPLATRVVVNDLVAPDAERSTSHLGGAATAIERVSSLCALPDGSLLATTRRRVRGWGVERLVEPTSDGSESRPFLAALEAAEPLPFAHLPPSADGPPRLELVGVGYAGPRERPLRLTSVVKEEKASGTILCLDVYESGLPALRGAERGTVRRVRIATAEGAVLGEAPVHPDGSFFVEVPADRALRLDLIGANGVIASDRSGLWLRPNENRACVGCHEDPERSPENRVPEALAKGAPPVRLVPLVDLEAERPPGSASELRSARQPEPPSAREPQGSRSPRSGVTTTAVGIGRRP